MEEDKEINYKTLRKIQQSEKKSAFLTKLYSGFSEDIKEYLSSMKKRLVEEKSEVKKNLLKEEVENNKKIIINIYEHREKKVVLAAVTKARGGDPDLNSMLRPERKLYDSILETLKDRRNKFFNQGYEETTEETEEQEDRDDEEEDEEKVVEEAEVRESNKNPVIRVVKDMPEFMGTDKRKYFLKKDDVLSIPQDMADMLEKRKAAEKIDYSD